MVLAAALPGAAMAQHPAAGRCVPLVASVQSLAVTPGRFLAGIDAGDYVGEPPLYASTDGSCWTPLITYPFNAHSVRGTTVGTIVVPPDAPRVIIAGDSWMNSDGAGPYRLYHSDDAGATWSSATVGLPKTAILPFDIAAAGRTLLLSFTCPADGAHAGPAVHCVQTLARSDDGGRSWHVVGPPPRAAAGASHGVVALADGTFLALFIAARPGSAPVSTFYHSRDEGRTWQAVGIAPAKTGADVATLYPIAWDARRVFMGTGAMLVQARAYQSTDGGAQWSGSVFKTADQIAAVVAFLGLAATHTLLLSDMHFIYRSTNGGTIWTRSSKGLSTNFDELVYTLASTPGGRTVYAGTSHGVYRSVDDGRSWKATASGGQ